MSAKTSWHVGLTLGMKCGGALPRNANTAAECRNCSAQKEHLPHADTWRWCEFQDFPVTEQACKSTTSVARGRQSAKGLQAAHLDSGPEGSILQQALPMGIDDAVQS